MQELALRKIPAIVPAKLLQVHGLRNDRPLIRCQFGVNVESVAGVQGEHDAERHLLNVCGRLAYPIANRDSLVFEFSKILSRLSLREIRRTLANDGEGFLVGNDRVPQDVLAGGKAHEARIDLMPTDQAHRSQGNRAVRLLLATDLYLQLLGKKPRENPSQESCWL